MTPSDEEVIETLSQYADLAAFFTTTDGGILYRSPSGNQYVLIIEDDALAKAAKDYLRRVGAVGVVEAKSISVESILDDMRPPE